MKIIVGLGNPGEKYEQTRHNIGFMIVRKIAEKNGISFRDDALYDSRTADMGEFNDKIKLVQPQTFMNESGLAVQKIKHYWKVDTEDMWVIHDDVDLKFGKVKIQLGGSSAGHKGVQSIIDHLDEGFWRIRVGVDKSDKIPTDRWVLSKFEDNNLLERNIDIIAENVVESLRNGIKEQTILI